MHGYNNSKVPIIDLEKADILHINNFDEFMQNTIIGVAKSTYYFATAYIGSQKTIYDQNQVELLSFYRKVMADPHHDEFMTVTKLSILDALNYLNLKYKCAYIGLSCALRMTENGRYDTKSNYDSCIDKPALKFFPFMLDEIKSWNIFDDFGRIVLFKNEHDSFTPIHYDWDHQDDFIWISLNGQDKKFFIYDEDKDIKHYVGNRRVITFNNADYHGSDPVNRCVVSLRIDGIFKKEIKDKIAQYISNETI